MYRLITGTLAFLGPSLLGQTLNTTIRQPSAQEHAEPFNQKPVENSISLASKLLKTDLKKGDIPLGKIEDLAFDLETSHLAIIVMESTDPDKQIHWNLIPFLSGNRLIKLEWENKTQLTSRPKILNRLQANELYRSFKQAIYWLAFEKENKKTPGRQFDDHDFNLTLVSEILSKQIVDKSGEVVGRIGDVATNSSDGKIAYLVLLTIDARRIAIPLGAFVSDDDKSRWMIDLDKDQIEKFDAFDETMPPSKVAPGWIEFVAVKYGREGIQSKKN